MGAQQIASLFGPNSEAQRQAARMEQEDPSGFNARLQEFQQLRAQHELEEANQAHGISEPIAPPQHQEQEPAFHDDVEPEPEVTETKEQPLSLTEQVQKAKSAKQSPVTTAQPESPWGKVPTTGFPMPFPPPPQSTTPQPTRAVSSANVPTASAPRIVRP